MSRRCAALLLVLAACQGKHTATEASSGATEPEPAPLTPPRRTPVPEAEARRASTSGWQCTSNSNGDTPPTVLRGMTEAAARPAAIPLSRGLLHPTPERNAPATDTQTLTIPADGDTWTIDGSPIEMQEVQPKTWVGEVADTNTTLTCWLDDPEQRFRYRPETGDCRRDNGEIGRHTWPLERIRETRDAECAVLTGLTLGEDDLSYPLLHWNLRGADLRDADLTFATLRGSMEGAKMEGLQYGYAYIKGQGDRFTTLPGGCRTGGETPIDCSQ